MYDKKRILELVKKNEEDEIELLRTLVSIPTCYNKQHDMKPIITELTREFKSRGYEVRSFSTSGAPVIVAELNRDFEKTLLFYNHYDVQPEEPLEDWKSPPYDLSFRNERLYGRGTNDNKGPLVANIFGVQNAFEAGYEPKCNIRFIIEGEEEAGSIHFEEFCKTNQDMLKSDGCIWEGASVLPDKRTKVTAGVKGDAYFELHAEGFYKDAHSGDAPIVVNPAWRLVWALSTLKNENEEIMISGYDDDVVPPRDEELKLFENYPPEQIDEYREKYKTDKFLLGREGVEFWKGLLLRPTCTICGLSGGWEGPGSKTVIGKKAMAKVDFRLVPDQKVDKVHELLRKHLDAHGFSDISIQLLSGYGPSRTPIDHPYILLLKSLVLDFSGREAILVPSHQGSGPAYLFGAHTPWASCDTFDAESNVHAPNESIRSKDLRYMTAFVAAVTTEIERV